MFTFARKRQPMQNRVRSAISFVKLGHFLRSFDGHTPKPAMTEREQEKFVELEQIVRELYRYNGWFVEENVRRMLVSLGVSLQEEEMDAWLNAYQPKLSAKRPVKTIAVIMAGNIPAVGFHDFMTVLISGNKLLAKLSSGDEKLLPALAELLFAIDPELENRVEFASGPLKGFDAVIATGSNNSSRYFRHYFDQYPHIIRKNRNGIAVLTGKETRTELEALADDIFSYYGLGCRNVSKIFVPADYDFSPLLDVLAAREAVTENHKYFNNYEYNKAVFLINGRKHFDTGTVLVAEDRQLSSPVSVLHYEYYGDNSQLRTRLLPESEDIQCIVSSMESWPGIIPFGKSQQPGLADYADGVDTLSFLLGLA